MRGNIASRLGRIEEAVRTAQDDPVAAAEQMLAAVRAKLQTFIDEHRTDEATRILDTDALTDEERAERAVAVRKFYNLIRERAGR